MRSGLAHVRRSGLSEIGLPEFLLFLLGCSFAIEVQLVGKVYLAELLMMALVPFLLLKFSNRMPRYISPWLIGLWLIWLGGQTLSDAANFTAMDDRLRGLGKIVFTATDLVALVVLLDGRPARIAAFSVGLAAAFAFQVTQDSYFGIDFETMWKFGIGRAVVWCALILYFFLSGGYTKPRATWIVGLVALGLMSVVLGSRSLGVFILCTTAYALAQRLVGLGRQTAQLSGVSLGLGLFLLCNAIVLAWTVYGVAAERGWLSETQRVKYEMQYEGDLVDSLVAGRSELLGSFQAILDAPFLGHGSWARDRDYAEARALTLYRWGITPNYRDPESDLIPTHSMIFGSWVESGLAGALFWSSVFLLAIRALLATCQNFWRLNLFGFFTTTWLVWDLLFSPFGANARLPAVLSIAIVLFILTNFRSPSSSGRPRSIASKPRIIRGLPV